MKIKRAKSFKKQYRAYDRRGYDMQRLDDAIVDIVTQNHQRLAEQSDHALKGQFKGDRELHIGGAGNWLLRYSIVGDRIELLLLATGTHKEVLGIE